MAEFLIILALIVVNGVFAMSEAAVISSRKARLQQQAERGDEQARAALALAEDPSRFLSTVQIGITLIGIMAGVFGGASLAGGIAAALQQIPFLAPYASTLAYGLVILVTTYLSLVLGELAPKRLALQFPERISMAVARPMGMLSRLTSPVVTLLGKSTDVVLWLLRVRASDEPPVTADEITTMVQQGVEAGVFTVDEHEIVEGALSLGERRARSIMTPRPDIVWLDLEATPDEHRAVLLEDPHSFFLVCEGDLDNVVGMVASHRLLARALRGEPLDLRADTEEALFVPESMLAFRVLDLMRVQNRRLAVVLGEHGGVEGVITLHDVLNELVSGIETDEGLTIVERADGSRLLDGMMPVEDVKEALDLDEELPGEGDHYETLGGFIMLQLGRVPEPADQFEWAGYRFEVVDMDGRRVDKVLVARVEAPPAADAETG